jgi:two-component system, NtrC family, sensor histidine kinase KinB
VKLKTKILAVNGLVLMLLGAVVVWALVNIISLGQASDAILRENYRSISAANNMINSLDAQAVLLRASGAKEGGSAFLISMNEVEGAFLEWLGRARDNITIPGEAELVDQISRQFAEFRLEFKNSIRDETAFSLDSLELLLHEVRSTCRRLLVLNENTMYEASNQARVLSREALTSTLITALTALVSALVLSFILAEKVVKPIYQIGEASRRLSDGDYSVKVPVTSRDELGTLAGEFNRMAAQLGRFHEMNIEKIVSEKNKADTILASIEDGLVVFDRDLSVAGINPAAQMILQTEGFPGEGLACESLFPHSPICSLIRDSFLNEKLSEIPEEDRTLAVVDGEGNPHHYQFTFSVIRGRGKPLSGIVVMLRDITRMKELENLKSEFVMAASHELRTPLTSLGMSIDLLREQFLGKASDMEQDLIDTAREEIQHMKYLTEDLLELSRLESGRIELEYDTVAVKQLFGVIEGIFRKQGETRHVVFTMSLPDDDLSFRGDANKITWVLSNLVSNALRYVPEQGAIDLSAARIGYNLHISVGDNGPGIPVEYQSRIFQKFSQIKGRKSGGSGLGLAICKEIIRAHGGTIWVESQQGKGSVFTFTLPLSG